jgi:ADP-ribose pyrophosphatase
MYFISVQGFAICSIKKLTGFFRSFVPQSYKKTQELEMTVQTDRQTLIYKGRVFNLLQEFVTLPNGVAIQLDVIRHPGAAAIVPLTRNQTVIMVQQYRHAVGGTIWEIPAGTLDDNESALACAQRELTEETGYVASTWQQLGEITPVPGYSDERIHLFLATELTISLQNLDPDEVLNVQEVAFSEALKMITQGIIQDAKTICGLMMAHDWLKNHPAG